MFLGEIIEWSHGCCPSYWVYAALGLLEAAGSLALRGDGIGGSAHNRSADIDKGAVAGPSGGHRTTTESPQLGRVTLAYKAVDVAIQPATGLR